MGATLEHLSFIVVLAPLLGSIIAGIGGKKVGRNATHWITIALMCVSVICAAMIFYYVQRDNLSFNRTIYTWGFSGRFDFNIGFLIDHLSSVMMLVVTFVSTVVHLYSVGYMRDESTDQRFFSYMSLFTFMMLMLVLANNFLQLFFGWEGVGLVSYLLIGYYISKESASTGALKAFIVNRIGDFGFILGLAAILDHFGTLNYDKVFANTPSMIHQTITILPHMPWCLITVICVLLFIGAMGKSAQIPLHVWLPESMEGPTPISALIHAATMVTAGVYMVARMSPMFEYSTPALSLVLVIGASGALFLGILAFVENDIKRIIAYSTMSQLGYMMAGNGASAFQAGIFHMMTHACFKALLFLSAGSLIVMMHHEQDIRKMGNLRKYMPATYITFLVGALALSAIPPFSGFYSKDSIIDAVGLSTIPGAGYAHWCLMLGSFVTGYYIFRAFFRAFHGKENIDPKLKGKIKESPWTIVVAMFALAIPATFLGMIAIKAILFTWPGLLGKSVFVLPQHNVLAKLALSYHGPGNMILQAFSHLPFWFAVSGIFAAWVTSIGMPSLGGILQRRFKLIHWVLRGQYGFDVVNDWVFTRGAKALARGFFRLGDQKILDEYIVNGSGRGIALLSRMIRRLQTGYLYQYVLVMVIGLLALLVWLLWGRV